MMVIKTVFGVANNGKFDAKFSVPKIEITSKQALAVRGRFHERKIRDQVKVSACI